MPADRAADATADRTAEPADRVVLYSRAGCHLCDVARVSVERVCRETGTAFREVDVDADPELVARYGDLVPVVTVDGHHHDHWRIAEPALREALAAP